MSEKAWLCMAKQEILGPLTIFRVGWMDTSRPLYFNNTNLNKGYIKIN